MRWPLRGPVLIGALALILLLGGFGSWAMLTRLDGAILAGGQVAMPGNRRVVHHPEGGVVAAIAVAEGTQVAAGDVLLTLDGTALRSDLALLEAQIYELLARQARLEAERDGKPVPRFDARLRDAPALRAGQARLLAARTQSDAGRVQQLRTRAGQVQDQITGLKAQQAATRAQQDLVAAELSALKTLLDKGLAPAARLGALQREAARLQGVAGDLSARIAEARGRITEVQIEINAIAVQRREEAISQLRDLRHRLLELEEHQGALQSRLAALHLRAPVAGTVHDLRVFGAQAVLRPAEPVATIIPRGRPGVVMADISPLDIDRVVSGMRVTLRLPALGRDPAAERTGHVVRVSADAFEGAAGQRFFRAEITLENGPPGTSALLPGMPVQVFIRTGAHSPLAYLTAPMRGYLERALRD
ncbi:HlyD family type I secretion periplasmic adaptor subunit [Rhodobacteraceae bacterium KMM 6894]|nr:HlyD family type I secretion periplasmic adaptor subunit [Rhodobacteraceae bacterium KMM 6894]